MIDKDKKNYLESTLGVLKCKKGGPKAPYVVIVRWLQPFFSLITNPNRLKFGIDLEMSFLDWGGTFFSFSQIASYDYLSAQAEKPRGGAPKRGYTGAWAPLWWCLGTVHIVGHFPLLQERKKRKKEKKEKKREKN